MPVLPTHYVAEVTIGHRLLRFGVTMRKLRFGHGTERLVELCVCSHTGGKDVRTLLPVAALPALLEAIPVLQAAVEKLPPEVGPKPHRFPGLRATTQMAVHPWTGQRGQRPKRRSP